MNRIFIFIWHKKYGLLVVIRENKEADWCWFLYIGGSSVSITATTKQNVVSWALKLQRSSDVTFPSHSVFQIITVLQYATFIAFIPSVRSFYYCLVILHILSSNTLITWTFKQFWVTLLAFSEVSGKNIDEFFNSINYLHNFFLEKLFYIYILYIY